MRGGKEIKVGDVVEDKEDGAEVFEAIAEAAEDCGVMSVAVFAFFVGDGVVEEFVEFVEGVAEVGGVFAGDVESTAGVDPGESMGVGVGEFGFSDAPQAMDADDNTGLVLDKFFAEAKQFFKPAGETGVVCEDSGGALLGFLGEIVF